MSVVLSPACGLNVLQLSFVILVLLQSMTSITPLRLLDSCGPATNTWAQFSWRCSFTVDSFGNLWQPGLQNSSARQELCILGDLDPDATLQC